MSGDISRVGRSSVGGTVNMVAKLAPSVIAARPYDAKLCTPPAINGRETQTAKGEEHSLGDNRAGVRIDTRLEDPGCLR